MLAQAALLRSNPSVCAYRCLCLRVGVARRTGRLIVFTRWPKNLLLLHIPSDVLSGYNLAKWRSVYMEGLQVSQRSTRSVSQHQSQYRPILAAYAVVSICMHLTKELHAVHETTDVIDTIDESH